MTGEFTGSVQSQIESFRVVFVFRLFRAWWCVCLFMSDLPGTVFGGKSDEFFFSRRYVYVLVCGYSKKFAHDNLISTVYFSTLILIDYSNLFFKLVQDQIVCSNLRACAPKV